MFSLALYIKQICREDIWLQPEQKLQSKITVSFIFLILNFKHPRIGDKAGDASISFLELETNQPGCEVFRGINKMT
jgi:hypothetical protein